MGLRKQVDKIKPNFEKGGKLSFLHSVFDGFEAFLFVPNTTTKKGTHVKDCVDLKRIMITVVVALLPAFLFGIYNIGYQHNLAFGINMGFWQIVWYGFIRILPLLLVSYIVGLGIEFISAQIKGHEINEGFLVTGFLIPLIMPIDVPLWMLALSTAFAVIIGKEVFGGTGMNIWNPALLARAFIFFSYPSHMTGDTVWIKNLSNGVDAVNGQSVVDAFSGATPLAQAAAEGHHISASFMDMFNGLIPGSIGETSVIAILIGAVILIATGVASWKIMLSSVAGGLFIGLLGNLFCPDGTMAASIPAYYQLVMGGFAFGTVFMATDPVSSCQTESGKWVFGFLVGSVAVIIRLFNPGYPEGMMLSILLANTFASLIDYIVVHNNINRRMNRAKVKTA